MSTIMSGAAGWTSLARLAAIGMITALCGCGKPQEPGSPSKSPDAKSAPAEKGAGGEKLRIAVVPKGTTHDFWKSIHAGAIKAEKELGTVEVTFRGPEREDDRQQQVDLVQNLVSAGYSAIVLAPLDDKALVSPVQQAMAAKIPVVIIDSGLQAQVGKDFVSFIATDNHKGGELAGQKMVELTGGKGKVLMLRYQEGSASTAQREQGFVDAIKAAPGIELIDPHRYAGATRATAQEAAENLLTAGTELAGIYCPNESSTFGMLLAIKENWVDADIVRNQQKSIAANAEKRRVETRKQVKGIWDRYRVQRDALGLKKYEKMASEEIQKMKEEFLAGLKDIFRSLYRKKENFGYEDGMFRSFFLSRFILPSFEDFLVAEGITLSEEEREILEKEFMR